jgi:hypothetical protein
VLSADLIVNLHDRETRAWHQTAETAAPEPAPAPDADLLGLVRTQHRANFELWHIALPAQPTPSWPG